MRNYVIGIILALVICDHCVLGQSFNEVLITEIMSDPSPSVGLPEVEYIELYNRTAKAMPLKGWKLVMGTRSVVFPDSLLLPNTYILLCGRSNVGALAGQGKLIGLAAFLLPNEGASLSLYNAKNQLVYSISYSDSWWPATKRNGGYALEMIDLDNPCGERDNWLASTNVVGGSPNKVNSVAGKRRDVTAPVLDHVEIPAGNELVLYFNKRLDSTSAAKGAEIAVAGRNVQKRSITTPDFRRLTLTFDSPFLAGQPYALRIKNLADCSGNLLRENTTFFGLPIEADSGDVVLNEVLFNPRTGGVDFVEIYNRSARYISIENWGLKNAINGSGDLPKIITQDKVVLPPNGFLALSVDTDIVKENYPTDKLRSFLTIPAMPAYANEEGTVVLQNSVGVILDRFHYSEKMHHPFISDAKGVSLERVDSSLPSGETANWHSAAGTVGYATPGYANSQALEFAELDDFYVEPEAFTPDNDGIDDVAEIRYSQKAIGRIATIQVFDINGFLVKTIVENQLVGTSGKIIWDGTNHQGRVVKTGYYLILINTFDVKGSKKQFKKKVVVATQ